MKWNKRKNTAKKLITLNQKSSPQGNVQRCPSNPQEKRCTGTGEETKIPKFKKRKIKELKEFKENGREENNQTTAKNQIKLTRRNKLN